MKPRFLFGGLIVGICLALLALASKFGGDADRSLRTGALLGVAVLYLASMWIRDRFLPPTSNPESVEPAKIIRPYWNPWFLLAAVFALIGASLMFVMRLDVAMSASEITRLMFKVSAWGVFLVTAAVSLANTPTTSAEQFSQWWLPGILLLIQSCVTVSLVPELVGVIARRPDAAPPNVANLVLVPFVVFAWRSGRFLRMLRTPGSGVTR